LSAAAVCAPVTAAAVADCSRKPPALGFGFGTQAAAGQSSQWANNFA